MSKLTPLQLASKINPNYKSPPHLVALQRFVAEILATPGQAKGIIELPVRHGKSEFCSRWLPSWFLLNNPDKHVILASYSGDFSREWGQKVRTVVQQYGRYFGVKMSESKRAESWTLDAGGGMKTCGVLGSITGKGSDLLIVDDPIKDQKEANSPTTRDAIHRWFLADALTRRSPDGKVLIVASKRHPDDLTGRLLSTDSGWRTLRLPALAEHDDPLHRHPGEALWPDRYSREQLLELKDELELSSQSCVWECLYQQNPTGDPASKEWPESYFYGIWAGMPQNNVRLKVLALDPSKGKHSHTGDYSAFVYLEITTDGHVYVQSILQRVPADTLGVMAVKLIDQLKPDGFIYEGAFLQGMFPTTHSYLYDSQENKAVRIRVALTPLLGQKKLHLDANCPGNRLWLSQAREFPHSSHDDALDATVMGLTLAGQLLHGKRPTGGMVLGV